MNREDNKNVGYSTISYQWLQYNTSWIYPFPYVVTSVHRRFGRPSYPVAYPPALYAGRPRPRHLHDANAGENVR